MKPDNVVKMPVSAPSFESLPAKEKQKLTTYGDGTPPFAGYVFDFDAGIPRWIPGEGVDDAYIGQSFETAKPVMGSLQPMGTPTKPALTGSVFITQTNDLEQPTIIAAYATRERAERDVAMIAKATFTTLQIIELPLEA